MVTDKQQGRPELQQSKAERDAEEPELIYLATVMITSIHTLIYSDDARATRAFLRDVLGWK
jgi:hypothetical protein